MDRWACVDALYFPLQVLLSEHPEWGDHPAAVLDKDHPQGRLLHLNRRARKARLHSGMRYGQALALVPHLRAAVVDDELLEDSSRSMAKVLNDYSPRVEPHRELPGLFWLDVSGMYRLYPTWQRWVEPLRARLREVHGIYVHIVVGFTRFGTFAVVRSTRQSGAFETPRRERQAAQKAPLDLLDLPSSVLSRARRLGLETVDDLLAMPAEGVRRRLGDRAFRLYRMARGDLRPPNRSFEQQQLAQRSDHLDHEEKNAHRILFLVKRHLHTLLDILEERGEKLAALDLVLQRREEADLKATIAPAEPTLDAGLITDLVRLRLESLPVESGISDVLLTARGARTTTEQMRLFADKPPRDKAAANRALARLRAEFGADAVVHIVPTRGHLPESRFSLHPLDELTLPDLAEADDKATPKAVRRFFPAPLRLRDMSAAPTRAGPHTICGGWWVREVHRDYHLIALDGRLLWIFYDHQRQRWYLHGEY